MIEFYYSTATCSTISHIALEEAGLAFKPVEVSWKRKVNVEELAKVNPLGAVPALLVDGKALTQTAAILEYIADAKPGKLLAAPGTLERAEALSWVAFATADLQKAMGFLFSANRMELDEKAKAEVRRYGTQNVLKYLEHADRSLTGREFIVGSHFTVADAALFTIIGWAKWQEIKTSPFKNVHAYMKRIYARPAVQKVLQSEGLLDYLQE